MDSQEIIRMVQAGSPMNLIIHDLIEEHSLRATFMQRLYKEYKGDVPIRHREYDYNRGEKIDRKLVNDYRGYIVDTLNGYLFGNPIAYSIDKDQYDEDITSYEKSWDLLKMFVRRNSVADLDAETAKKASICGYGARLIYIDKEGSIRLMNVDPWECIFIKDPSLDEAQYALRYYPMEHYDENHVLTTTIRAEWYDDTTYQEFEENSDGIFVAVGEPKEHLIPGVPLLEFPNNEERLGDFEKVRDLIDSYDILVSDVQSELEEQRLAYLVFAGAEITKATLDDARKTGAFNMPDANDKVYYLVKNLSDNVIENQKTTLRENIHKFSKTVDMSDEKFSGASQSGESRKWKLLAMENLATIKERKFSRSLRIQFKLIEDIWQERREPVLDSTVVWKFSRNLPIEITQEAQVLAMLNGHISHRTRLNLASFIEDADTEINQMLQEAETMIPPPLLTDEEEEVEDEPTE